MFGAHAPMPFRLGGGALDGVTPEQHARFCADLVAVKRVAPLAMCTVDTTPTAEILYYVGQNGYGLSSQPNISRVSTGIVRVTWDGGFFTDEYGVTAPWRIRACIANPHSTNSEGACVTWEEYAPTPTTYGVELQYTEPSNSPTDGLITFSVW